MILHRNRYLLILALALFSLLTIPIGAGIQAQDNPIVISLTVPEYTTSIFEEDVFDEFEAANPGVQVQINKVGMDMYYGSAVGGLDEHLESVAKYASSADVLYVSGSNISVEATRAGYFLDLTPLTSIDTTLNSEDFIPATWESYQWDGGIWAMPVSASVYLLMYQPDKFDAAGVSYPDEAWTIDDFENAVTQLTQKNESGETTIPGFVSFGNLGLFLYSLSGVGYYDSATFPNPPLFTNPALEPLLTTWAELTQDGYVDTNVDSSNIQEIPMRIEQSLLLSNLGSDNEHTWEGTLLPGGIAGLGVEAFAISSGTQYPEQAYALLKYLSNNVEIINSFISDTPARQSLIGIESENGIQTLITRTPEVEALVQEALANAVPLSELRYGQYVENAVTTMNTDGVDALTALQQAETHAIENLETAESRRGDTVVFVVTPIATPVLSAGETSLKFGLTSFFTPFPNREAWLQAVDDFTAIDPQIGQITFEDGTETQLQNLTDKYDCFYMPYNIIPSTTDLSPLLNLDPFMSADPNFDNNDLVGNTLEQLQKDNKIWGYPIVIQPQVLSYNAESFQNAGVPQPENGWTIEAFRDALEQLQAVAEDADQPIFVSNSFGGNHLLVLIAAYGGVPVDYRTTPVSLKFTDPATVEAIRQVLDLAKDGYIQYSALGNFAGGFFGNTEASIVTASLDSATLFQFAEEDESVENTDDPYLMTLYPTGNQYNGISYDIGTGYISANAQNPDACYRWLTYVSERPDLLGAMPARRSIINDGQISASQGEVVTTVYNQIDTLLQNPNTISFPSPLGSIGSPGDLLVQLWLYRAFDSYVLEDGDLEAELQEAETLSKAYQGCVANIPANTLGPDATQADQIAYFRQYTDCAASVDPSMESLFGF